MTASLQTRLDVVNTTLAVSGENPDKLRQSIADLRLGVGDLTKQLETVVNKSLGNSQGIDMLNKELNTLKVGREYFWQYMTGLGLKYLPPAHIGFLFIQNYFQLNEIDMKNGKVTPPASPNANLTVLDHKLDLLNLSVEIQSQRMDTINTTVLGIERNSTLRIDLEHEDVVALNVSVRLSILLDISSLPGQSFPSTGRQPQRQQQPGEPLRPLLGPTIYFAGRPQGAEEEGGGCGGDPDTTAVQRGGAHTPHRCSVCFAKETLVTPRFTGGPDTSRES